MDVDRHQSKQVFLLEKLVGLDLVVPDIQRSLDKTRVGSIVEFQRTYFETHATFCFLGDLIVFQVGGDGDGGGDVGASGAGTMLLIDGQHRYEAMKAIYMMQPDYKVSVTMLYGRLGMTLEKAFLLINMSRPVPEYVIQTTMQHTKRVFMENVRATLHRLMRPYVSNAAHPRVPNVNLERIIADLLVSGLSERFNSVDALVGYIKFANHKLSTANHKVRRLALEKADKTDSKYVVYLSADAGNDWMTNVVWIGEYASTLVSTADPYRGPIRVIPRKRQALPKAIRDMLWKNHFGTHPVGLCKCCHTNSIEYTNFHAGHVVSKAHGGSDELSNLLPTCAGCNLGMGAMNMSVFQNKFGIGYAGGEAEEHVYRENVDMMEQDER